MTPSVEDHSTQATGTLSRFDDTFSPSSTAFLIRNIIQTEDRSNVEYQGAKTGSTATLDETTRTDEIKWDTEFDDPTADILLEAEEGYTFRVHSWHLKRKRSVSVAEEPSPSLIGFVPVQPFHLRNAGHPNQKRDRQTIDPHTRPRQSPRNIYQDGLRRIYIFTRVSVWRSTRQIRGALRSDAE